MKTRTLSFQETVDFLEGRFKQLVCHSYITFDDARGYCDGFVRVAPSLDRSGVKIPGYAVVWCPGCDRSCAYNVTQPWWADSSLSAFMGECFMISTDEAEIDVYKFVTETTIGRDGKPVTYQKSVKLTAEEYIEYLKRKS